MISQVYHNHNSNHNYNFDDKIIGIIYIKINTTLTYSQGGESGAS